MLAITGGMNTWFIANVNDMRIGRRRLLEIVKDRFPNPYNGDLFAFMSKNRRLLKMVRYEHHMYMPIIFTPWRWNPWLKHRYLKWNVKTTYIK